MKKLILAIFIFGTGISAINAQFLYAAGAAIGLSDAKHGWNPGPIFYQEKYIWGWNGAILAEFFQDEHYKWRSEIMYNQLGTEEINQNDGGKYVNHTYFISWNNYWMIRYPLYSWVPYFLIGPRLAYLDSRSAEGVFGGVIGAFYTIHVTAAAGVGVEPVWYSRFKPFVEVFYNHDLMPSYIGHTPDTIHQGTYISAHDWEFRIGLKYVFKRKSKCPAVDNKADGEHPNFM